MTRHVALVIGALIAGVRPEGPIRVPDQGTFRARTDVVSVTVAVQAGGQPVKGLTAADFDLTDNGVRQKVDIASLERTPLDLTVVFAGDLLSRDGSDGYRRLLVQASLRQLLPADRLRIVWLQRDPLGGGLVGQFVYRIEEEAVPLDTSGKSHYGALVDGLFYALAWPVDADRRHLIVALTDGWDGFSSALEAERLPKLAAHSDSVLHAVLLPPAWAGDAAASRRIEATIGSLSAAVEGTGGSFHRTQQAPAALTSIVADFRTTYLLRYTPLGVQPGGWHELRVRIKRPGSFTIRARKGYEGTE